MVIIKPSILPTPLDTSSVVGHLLNTLNGDDVEHVLVDGMSIVQNQKLMTFNESEVQRISQTAASKLWARLENMKPQVDQFR